MLVLNVFYLLSGNKLSWCHFYTAFSKYYNVTIYISDISHLCNKPEEKYTIMRVCACYIFFYEYSFDIFHHIEFQNINIWESWYEN